MHRIRRGGRFAAEQVAATIQHDSASLTPQRMLRFMQQALRRMNTVEDPNPYGRAVIGVEQMPAALQQLNDMLLQPDDVSRTRASWRGEHASRTTATGVRIVGEQEALTPGTSVRKRGLKPRFPCTVGH